MSGYCEGRTARRECRNPRRGETPRGGPWLVGRTTRDARDVLSASDEWDPLSFLVLGRPQTLMLTVLGGAGRVRERVDPRPHNGRGRAKSGDALGPRLLPNDTSREMPYRLVPEQNRVQ